MIPLLVLRPEPGATATAERARALGLETIVAPLFAIAPLAWAAPPAGAYDALMLTSANAVRHAGPALALYRALPVHAVGEATAAAARGAGFAQVQASAGDAADLVASLAGAGIARALHLCGADRREADHPAVRIERVMVYRAAAVATLPPDIRALLPSSPHSGPDPGPVRSPGPQPREARPDVRRYEPGATEEDHAGPCPAAAPAAVALLHSPRAAALFAALLDSPGRARIAIVAISPAAARAAGPGWHGAVTAPAPTDAALLAVAARLCEDGG